MSNRFMPRLSGRQRLGLGGAALLAIGAAGGGGAVSLTRPAVDMAPTTPTPISRLSSANGIVTVRGHVAEVYGDRFVVQDATGRTLVDAGRGGDALRAGSPIMVQGRFGDGQLRARFLVDSTGTVEEVGPPRPPHGRGAPPPRGPNAPTPPPSGGAGAPRPIAGVVVPANGQQPSG